MVTAETTSKQYLHVTVFNLKIGTTLMKWNASFRLLSLIAPA